MFDFLITCLALAHVSLSLTVVFQFDYCNYNDNQCFISLLQVLASKLTCTMPQDRI